MILAVREQKFSLKNTLDKWIYFGWRARVALSVFIWISIFGQQLPFLEVLNFHGLSAIKGISILSFACSQIYLSGIVAQLCILACLPLQLPSQEQFCLQERMHHFKTAPNQEFQQMVFCVLLKRPSALGWEEEVCANSSWLGIFKTRCDAFLKHENTINSMGLFAMVFWQLKNKKVTVKK